jgi:hypothetical protein
MPQRPLVERIKRAKRAGVPFAVKENEQAPGTERSRHSVKKSRGIVEFEPPPDRRVSTKAPPGRGRNNAASKSSGSRGQEPDISGRHVVTVRGRKKPPSEMHIRHPGG